MVVVAVAVVVVLMFFDRNNKRTSKDSCYQNLSVCWLYDGMEWVPSKHKQKTKKAFSGWGITWRTTPLRQVATFIYALSIHSESPAKVISHNVVKGYLSWPKSIIFHQLHACVLLPKTVHLVKEKVCNDSQSHSSPNQLHLIFLLKFC